MIDLTGQRFGHLTAIRPTDQRRKGATVWEWRCDCGATVLKPPSSSGMRRREGSKKICNTYKIPTRGLNVAINRGYYRPLLRE